MSKDKIVVSGHGTGEKDSFRKGEKKGFSVRLSIPAYEVLELVLDRLNEGSVSLEGLDKEEGKEVYKTDIIEKALWDFFEKEGFQFEDKGIHINIPKKYQKG